MQQINEDKLAEFVIDFDVVSKGQLNESWLAMFGWWSKLLLRKMFGEDLLAPVTLKGKKSDIESFYKALASEKNYLTKYKSYGLNDPRTLRDRVKLEIAVRRFVRQTGLRWPFV